MSLEEWVNSAMTNDTMVVELLIQLHRTSPAPPPLKPPAFPLEWTVRQRRSKSISINNNWQKPAHRYSPTTPLSWSFGATSISGGLGGSNEESSGPLPFKFSSSTRSKDNADSGRTASKKPRKKKTLSELKEEENMLIRERRELKRELTVLRLNLEEQKDTNERFKRVKLELQPRLDTSLIKESVSEKREQKCNDDLTTLQTMCPRFVLLPDLNMTFNDDPSSEVICGVN